ncbi:MAG: DUF6481 family protein [Sphingomonas sp.]|jgi:hypothetical protein
MVSYKAPSFNERAAMASAARQKALEKLRTKPAPDEALVAERLAAREARDAAAAEKRRAKLAAAEEAKEAKRAEAARKAELANQPDPNVKTEAELKAARDARYAARKAKKR